MTEDEIKVILTLKGCPTCYSPITIRVLFYNASTLQIGITTIFPTLEISSCIDTSRHLLSFLCTNNHYKYYRKIPKEIINGRINKDLLDMIYIVTPLTYLSPIVLFIPSS